MRKRRVRRNPTRYKKASTALYKVLKEAGVTGRDNLIAYRKILDDLEIEYDDFIDVTVAQKKHPAVMMTYLINGRLNSDSDNILDEMPEHAVSYAVDLLKKEVGSFTEDDLQYFVRKHPVILLMASHGAKVPQRRIREAASDLANTLLS